MRNDDRVKGFFRASEFKSEKDKGLPSPYPFHVKDELIDLLNDIRKEFGMPIVINSGYRSPQYNHQIGGVAGSQHCLGCAADIRPTAYGKTFKQYTKAIKRLQILCLKHNPNGGIGLYDWGVHIDIREKKARWDYRTEDREDLNQYLDPINFDEPEP